MFFPLFSGRAATCAAAKAAAPAKEAFLPCQLTSRANGIIVVYIDDFVNNISVVGLGNKAGTNALYLVRPALSAVEHGARQRLHGDDLYAGVLLLEIAAYT